MHLLINVNENPINRCGSAAWSTKQVKEKANKARRLAVPARDGQDLWREDSIGHVSKIFGVSTVWRKGTG